MQSVDVLLQPVISEKALQASGLRQYAFLVDRRARKEEIRKAVEAHYDVNVVGITTAQYRQSPRRQTKGARKENNGLLAKKAYVTLKEGQSLDLLGSSEE